ncbi:MAG: calcium-binding protein [Alphaproteobacteria bacterium]|nr:calcium-binding protein [Alphaproteobacteria bacterium]
MVQIRGSNIDNTLNGTGSADDIYGFGGQDTLNGNGGNDRIFGGSGDDSSSGGANDDTFFYEGGNDTFNGGSGHDIFDLRTATVVPIGNDLTAVQEDDVDFGISLGAFLSFATDATTTAAVTVQDDGVFIGAGDGGFLGDLRFTSVEEFRLTRFSDFFQGRDQDAVIDMRGGNDLVEAGAGIERIIGGTGLDWVTYEASNAAVSIALEGSPGADGSGSGGFAAGDILTSIEAAAGSNFGDSLIGRFTGADTLAGLKGNDGLIGLGGDDTLLGGAGNDTLTGGLDDDSLEGGDDDDRLVGNSGLDALAGGAGNDTLRGGDDEDTLNGGTGTDTADFSDKSVGVVAAAGGSIFLPTTMRLVGSKIVEDRLISIENLIGGSGGDSLTGNSAANELTGNGGNDTLTGGLGADTLSGGSGNDFFRVDSAADVVGEGTSGGADTVEASVSYTLAAGVAVETLRTSSDTGTGAIDLTGNDIAQSITGNDGANRLDGGGENDTLLGRAGSDTLTGGAGTDTLDGGTGDDTYVNPLGDTIVELAGGGLDSVQSDASFTLPDEVERLFLTGSAADGTGNGLANQVIGNAADNVLTGLGSSDTLSGGGGFDTLLGGDGADQLRGGTQRDKYIPGVDSDADTLIFNILNDSTGIGRDVITRADFDAEDRIDLPVAPTAIAAAIAGGTLSTTSFNADLAAAVNAAALPAGQAVLFDPSAGNLDVAGMVYLVVDANGVAGYQAGQDWVFQLENCTGDITVDDFV